MKYTPPTPPPVPATTPYGIPLEELARLARVHPDTARRWKREQRIPPPYDWLVALAYARELGCLEAAWTGWTLRGGVLVSPEGWPATPGEVLAIPIQAARIRALERERERAKPAQRLLDFG